MVLVRRALVDFEQPPSVRRHVGDRLPRQALEVLAHQRDALGRAVGLLVMDGADPRIDLLEHVVADPRRLDARIGVRRRPASAAERCRPPPSASSARLRVVLFEQVAEEGRSGAEHADHDERRVDALVGDVGCRCAQSTIRSRFDEAADDVGADRGGAELVELRLGRRRRAVDVRPSRKLSPPKSSSAASPRASAISSSATSSSNSAAPVRTARLRRPYEADGTKEICLCQRIRSAGPTSRRRPS